MAGCGVRWRACATGTPPHTSFASTRSSTPSQSAAPSWATRSPSSVSGLRPPCCTLTHSCSHALLGRQRRPCQAAPRRQRRLCKQNPGRSHCRRRLQLAVFVHFVLTLHLSLSQRASMPWHVVGWLVSSWHRPLSALPLSTETLCMLNFDFPFVSVCQNAEQQGFSCS